MLRRVFPILSALLLAGSSASARIAHFPLDPASLGGADIFTDAEKILARAATTAGIAFISAPLPLPPQVILPLDTAREDIRKRNGLLFWRGDMLPDQLAPAEIGTLVRKRREPDGTWKRLRTLKPYALEPRILLVPVIRTGPTFTLPRMIIETSYQLGSLDGAPVSLVLWRTAEEDSSPIGGSLALVDPPPALLDALSSAQSPFSAQAEWAAEFDAFSP